MIKVEGHDYLFRDEKTGAIVNTDSSSYASYVAAKKRKKLERAELDEMKAEITEIKDLLKQITSKL
tara:strand:+ start:1521 stop:1718 length:198 start_codon:yes stop_codon:yes gene_type:complete